MKRVALLYFDVTSSHRSSVLALEKALYTRNEPIQVRVLNLTEILAFHSALHRLATIGIDVFNWGVQHERAYYYHLADVIVGKPGSIAITEALVTRSASLAIKSKSLAVVPRGNEAWLRQSGVGDVIRVPRLAGAVDRILKSKTVNSSLNGNGARCFRHRGDHRQSGGGTGLTRGGRQ